MKLRLDGEVFILDLGDGENRIGRQWCRDMNEALSEIESAQGPRALMTVAEGKFFSNGLDVEWMGVHLDEIDAMLHEVEAVLGRLLVLPVPSVAVLQGHTYAAGAMLALAHDYRVMRSDRGFFCLPEVDIDMVFQPGMAALLRAKLPPETAREAVLFGRRYGGIEAQTAGLVDESHSADELSGAGRALVEERTGKAGDTLGSIKAVFYAEAVTALGGGSESASTMST